MLKYKISATSTGKTKQGVLIVLKFTYNLKIIHLRDFFIKMNIDIFLI